MKKRHIPIYNIILFLILSTIFSCDNNKQVSENKMPGQGLFEANCVSCHGIDGKLKAGTAKDLSVSTLDRNLVIQAIQKGSPERGMPPYEKRLNAKEIEELSDYVLNLRN
jgi:mono/diheme cytochrome c family protein